MKKSVYVCNRQPIYVHKHTHMHIYTTYLEHPYVCFKDKIFMYFMFFKLCVLFYFCLFAFNIRTHTHTHPQKPYSLLERIFFEMRYKLRKLRLGKSINLFVCVCVCVCLFRLSYTYTILVQGMFPYR